MVQMQYAPEQLYGALHDIGRDDRFANDVPADIIDQLIAFKMVQRGDDGKSRLTPYGEKCFVVIESGDGHMPEFEWTPSARFFHRAARRQAFARVISWQTTESRIASIPALSLN
jgi:hypothetical protein